LVITTTNNAALHSDNNEFDDEFGIFFPDLSYIELEDHEHTTARQNLAYASALAAFKKNDGALRYKYMKAYDLLALLLQFKVTVSITPSDPRWISDDFFLSIVQTIVDLGVMLMRETWLDSSKLMRDCILTDWTVSRDLKYSRSNRIRLLLTFERLWDKPAGCSLVKHDDLMLVWLMV
jgi:hypothetical protein